MVGASEDGSYVYFAANGVLGDGAQHGAVHGDCQVNEQEAPSQRCNLYLYHEGTTRLVAVLSGMDAPDWGPGYLKAPTARVSPDGRWLAFMSERSLTGYDNRDAVSGRPDEEVYQYDAQSEHLSCASCDPTGARPHGREWQTLENGAWSETSRCGIRKPGWRRTSRPGHPRPTRTPSTSRVISQTADACSSTRSDGLVPKDANEQQDVYEYEPAGVGPGNAKCGPSAASGGEVFRPEHEFEAEVEGQKQTGTEGAGCVALISSGTSGEESAFMEASQTGSDVFFITHAHLVPGTIENGLALYDAHECTTASPCTHETETPPPCKDAEGCRPAPEPQPPIYGPPSSATFHGPGNPTPEAVKPPPPPPHETPAQIKAKKLKAALKACRKLRNKKKRTKCEKAAHKAYGAKASSRRAKK